PETTRATESAVGRVARLHRVHVRVLDGAGQVLEDHDFDSGRDFSERAGGVVLRSGSGQKYVPADELRGAIANRDEVRQALATGAADGCEDSAEHGMLVCYAARAVRGPFGVRVVHVQDSA